MSYISQYELAFQHVVGVEGGYCNDPNDSGGETCFGITKRVAMAHGYTGAMKDLPLETAKSIYRDSYWNPLKLSQVATVTPALALELFDSAVNCGIDNAGRWMQRALNVLNQGEAVYANIPVDGSIGPLTLTALTKLVGRRGAKQADLVMTRLCNSLQGAYYVELAERRGKDEAFVFGWAMNRLAGSVA